MTPIKWVEPEELIETYPRRAARRRASGETFTALLSCKPLDVELRRLQRAAARSKARLKNKAKP